MVRNSARVMAMIMVLAACVTVVQRGRATEILAILTADRAILAADSLIANLGEAAAEKCKIRQTGNLFWAAAGLDADTFTGFGIDDFVHANSRVSDAAQFLDDIGDKVRGPLQTELSVLAAQQP